MRQINRSEIISVIILCGFVFALCIPFLRDLDRLPGHLIQTGCNISPSPTVFMMPFGTTANYRFGTPISAAGYAGPDTCTIPDSAPWGLIYALSGDVVGLKLVLIFTLLLGGLSVYGVARSFLLLPPAFALFAALLYLSSLWMAGQLESGNYTEFSLYFWPLALIGFHGLMRGRWIALLLPMFFVIALDPLKYTAPAALAAALLIILFSRVYREQRAFAAVVWLIGSLFGFLWAMPKLLPLQDVFALNLVDLAGRKAEGYESIGRIYLNHCRNCAA